MIHARVPTVGHTAVPLRPSPDAKPQIASLLERKGQQKNPISNIKLSKKIIKKFYTLSWRKERLEVEPRRELPQGSLSARIATVTHEIGCMAIVENPTQGFGEHIRLVYDSRKMS